VVKEISGPIRMLDLKMHLKELMKIRSETKAFIQGLARLSAYF